MLKKVYFISKIILTGLILISMLKSCAKAVDTTIQAEIREKLQILCEKQAYGLDRYAYQNIDLTDFNSTGYVIVIGKGNNNSYRGQLDTTNKLYIIPYSLNGSISNWTNDTSNSSYNDWYFTLDTIKFTLTGSKQQKGFFPLNNLVEPFYCYTTVPINTRVLTLGPGEEHGGSYIIPTFEFVPTGEEVTINNLEVNALKLNNMVIPFNLGQIIDLENYYNVMVSLIDASDNNVLDVYSTRSGVGNGLLQKSGNGYILASSTRLYYKHIYKLSLDVFEESNSSDNYEYYYIFLPPNAVISSGIIENYGSGDFSNQDLAISNEQNSQEVINAITDSSEVDSIVSGNLPTINNSGDVLSFAEEMGYSSIEFPFTTFLMNLVDGLYDAVTSRENINLSANYGSLNFSINSSDFIIPDNALRFVIRNMLIFIYIYGNYKYIHYLFSLLYTARVNDLTSELGTDEFYDKNYM